MQNNCTSRTDDHLTAGQGNMRLGLAIWLLMGGAGWILRHSGGVVVVAWLATAVAKRHSQLWNCQCHVTSDVFDSTTQVLQRCKDMILKYQPLNKKIIRLYSTLTFSVPNESSGGWKNNTISPNGDVGRNQILPWCWNISTLWGAKSQWNLSTCDREILRTILWQWIDVSRDWLDGNTWEQLPCCFNCWSGWDGLKYCSAGAQNTEIQEWWDKKYIWQQQQFQRKRWVYIAEEVSSFFEIKYFTLLPFAAIPLHCCYGIGMK